MRLNAVDLYVFSGTGNTLVVARRLAARLRQAGVDVRFRSLTAAAPAGLDRDRCIGFLFPVAMQSTYPFVWRFLRALPDASGTPVFMVDTLHAFSGGIVGPLRRLLRRKGYRPLAAAEIKMPSNFFPPERSREEIDVVVAAGLRRTDAFAAELLSGAGSWGHIPGPSDLLCFLSTRRLLWWLLRRLLCLTVDADACTQCGLCIRLCPVANLLPGEDGTPVVGDHCELCMRCQSFCPGRAISMKRFTSRAYRAVDARDLLEMESGSADGTTDPADT